LYKDKKHQLDLLRILVEKELILKYRGTVLGVLWSLLNPLLSILVYYIVFGVILKIGKEGYLNYLISGVLMWSFMSSSILLLTNNFLYNAPFIKKLPVNHIIFPIATMIANAIPYFLLIIAAKLLIKPSITGIFLIFIWYCLICVQLFFFGLILALTNSFVKDINYIVSFLLNLAFYLSPVVYSIEQVPTNLRWLILINPLATDIAIWQNIFFNKTPEVKYIISYFTHTLLIGVITLKVYKKTHNILPEVL